MLRAKDIKPFYPQSPKELKQSPGSEKATRIGSMSQAKLTRRNMKVLRKQFFPEQGAEAAESAEDKQVIENDIKEFNSLMAQMENLREHRGPLLPKALVLLFLLFGLGGSFYLVSSSDVHTPSYTNGFSLFFTVLCHVGIVVSLPYSYSSLLHFIFVTLTFL